MFRVFGVCCLLLTICNYQRVSAKRFADGTVYEQLQVFQKYPLQRSNTDQTQQFFHKCSELSGKNREIQHHQGNEQPRYEPYCTSILQNCKPLSPLYNKRWEFCVPGFPTSPRRYMLALQYNKYNQQEGKQYGQDRNRTRCHDYDQFISDDACLCDCESSEITINRYFSLLDVVADDGKVVTAVRIKKDNHVFHIQIQQGTLGQHGKIVGQTNWKKIRAIPNSRLQSNEVSQLRKADNGDNLLSFYKNNLVYAVSYQQKTILLDDLRAGPDEVVTGLRFRQIGNDLQLEIQVTPFDDKNATLQSNAKRWIRNEVDQSARKAVELASRDVSTSYKGPYVTSSTNTYVQFQTSNFDKDLGQTTVPFIDVRDDIANPAKPLLGVGIRHNGQKDSTGFIALKAFR